MNFRQNGKIYATPDQAFLMFDKAGVKLGFYDFCLRSGIIITDFVRCYSELSSVKMQRKELNNFHRGSK